MTWWYRVPFDRRRFRRDSAEQRRGKVIRAWSDPKKAAKIKNGTAIILEGE